MLQLTTYNLRQKTILVLLLVVLLFVVGHIAYAQNVDPSQGGDGGLVRCGRTNDEGVIENQCGWDDLITTAQLLVNWLVYISVSVATVMFTYAGYLYVTSGGSEEQVKKAHDVFRNVIVGFILVLAAWLIVYTISVAVVKDTGILLLGS